MFAGTNLHDTKSPWLSTNLATMFADTKLHETNPLKMPIISNGIFTSSLHLYKSSALYLLSHHSPPVHILYEFINSLDLTPPSHP
jgi:hypothetical protein